MVHSPHHRWKVWVSGLQRSTNAEMRADSKQKSLSWTACSNPACLMYWSKAAGGGIMKAHHRGKSTRSLCMHKTVSWFILLQYATHDSGGAVLPDPPQSADFAGTPHMGLPFHHFLRQTLSPN
ncbi:hypothetical protein PIB30_047339 [Stylosanthes scabra]|uniref:Uncharacterized protein n=1 Tax=Stylosanthes scabra TaxID=79078 RepID=A0ABU6SHW7_9FABA|nr:hypothetical protein [Stylosanthes scabra]